jgi:hypothetical protein
VWLSGQRERGTSNVFDPILYEPLGVREIWRLLTVPATL